MHIRIFLCCLIASPSLTFCEEPLAKSVQCFDYTATLPRGVCQKYLRGKTVLIDSENRHLVEHNLGIWFKVALPSVLDLTEKLSTKKFKRHLYGTLKNFTCFGKSRQMTRLMKEFVESLPSSKEMHSTLKKLLPFMNWSTRTVDILKTSIHNKKRKNE